MRHRHDCRYLPLQSPFLYSRLCDVPKCFANTLLNLSPFLLYHPSRQIRIYLQTGFDVIMPFFGRHIPGRVQISGLATVQKRYHVGIAWGALPFQPLNVRQKTAVQPLEAVAPPAVSHLVAEGEELAYQGPPTFGVPEALNQCRRVRFIRRTPCGGGTRIQDGRQKPVIPPILDLVCRSEKPKCASSEIRPTLTRHDP